MRFDGKSKRTPVSLSHSVFPPCWLRVRLLLPSCLGGPAPRPCARGARGRGPGRGCPRQREPDPLRSCPQATSSTFRRATGWGSRAGWAPGWTPSTSTSSRPTSSSARRRTWTCSTPPTAASRATCAGGTSGRARRLAPSRAGSRPRCLALPLPAPRLGVKRCSGCLLLHRRPPNSVLRAAAHPSQGLRGQSRLLAGLRLVEAGQAAPSTSGAHGGRAAGRRLGSRQLGPLVGGSWQLPSERDHVLP